MKLFNIPTMFLFAVISMAYSCSPKWNYANPDYKVKYLFERDGCRVYRFYDRGEYVYFTNCTGEITYRDSTNVIKNMIHKNEK